MEICTELKILAHYFEKENSKLYIVGGYTRDSLLGLDNKDIDITSSLDCDKVINICKQLDIKTVVINKRLGTLQLQATSQTYEYTQFRTESYGDSGVHSPDNVQFVKSVSEDCLRRDFAINAIYYCINTEQFEDPLHGIKDLERKIIRTCRTPELTLKDDGLRILRAIRFSSTLGFSLEKKTLKALIQFTPLLKKISRERILKELEQIVVADRKLNFSNNNFLTLANKCSLCKYMFNSNLNRMRKFSKQDMKKFYSLETNSRLIGFYILILQKYLHGYIGHNQLAYNINMLLGVNGLKESKNNISITEKIYRILQNLDYSQDLLNASINYLTLSDSERNIIDTYISKKAKQILSDNISHIKANNLPISIHQLDITAQDLLDLGIKNMYISKILSTLYNQVLNMCVKNSNEDLKNLAKEINETFLNIKEKL